MDYPFSAWISPTEAQQQRTGPPGSMSNADWVAIARGEQSGANATPFGGNVLSNAVRISPEAATGAPLSSDILGVTYSASITAEEKRPRGPITTLLDLVDRDIQDNDLFPLRGDTTWFARDTERKLVPFTPLLQELAYRGPAAFGQRISFDLGALNAGDLLFGAALQIQLDHWLDPQTQLLYDANKLTYLDSDAAWEYANSLGSSIIALAELEIDGLTTELIDGDFINAFAQLYSDYNTQVPIAYDHLGRISIARLVAQSQPRLFPTEGGILHCILPFGFGRTRYQDALPLVAMREGLARIHITFRPFEDCVRQLRGYRDSCTATPLGQEFRFQNTNTSPPSTWTVTAAAVPPPFKSVQLVTYGAVLDGTLRKRMLHDPFEVLYRQVQTFTFDEPLKYSIGKRNEADSITVQLPLEPNHPLEEIIWFVRRKGVGDNNAWTNYTSVLEAEWDADKARIPLLRRAVLQVNGVTLCDADEQYYRQLIAGAHRGGAAAYNAFLYGYPFARTPGEHQPSGTLNASRTNSIRLTLDVRPPGGALDGNWEVKVFCIGLNWMRFENGIANPMFED